MLETGAWVPRAARANAVAQRLAALMPFPIAHPVQASGVFVEMDDQALAGLNQAGWFVYPANYLDVVGRAAYLKLRHVPG